METRKTFCRAFSILCSLEVNIKNGRVIASKGDRVNAVRTGWIAAGSAAALLDEETNARKKRNSFNR